ncbi:MAG: protein kinase [Planctomycetes bacterium]|nr:protein kinase [Planctomycetota bacterium]
MGPAEPHDSAEPDERISALVSQFFDRRHSGEPITPESFVAEHPELTEQLRQHLAGLPLIDKVCTLSDSDTSSAAAPGLPEHPPMPGHLLIEEIGRGGMGVVYKALQTATKRIVALKVILAGPFASTTARRRFEREVELAARLQHPNIVRVLESGHVSGQQYYAMDYVTGMRLDRYLAAEQPDVRAVLELFLSLCEAIEYAHGHGVIHRDLKPANVLIDDEAQPHILDFGLAKATDQPEAGERPTTSVSIAGQVVGTLFYLSPEQAAGTPDEIDVRTDVYALGVMLYEALTGALPYDTRGRPADVIQRILETPPVSPRARSAAVNSELETIILKALEKNRACRYQSVQELADDIRRYIAGEPLLARRPSSLYVLRKKLHKHRWRVAAGVGALLIVLCVVVLESYSRHKKMRAARLEALECQRILDSGAVMSALGDAQNLCERFRRLPEATLVWAQAQYLSEEMRGGSVAFLERVNEHHPAYHDCRALLAEICRAAGDPERARTLEAEVAQHPPERAEDWYVRSFATLDVQRALRCVERAVQQQPGHTLAWRRLTYLRLQTGDLDGALRSTDRLIELGDEPQRWILYKGHVLARQGRLHAAIEQFKRCGAHLDQAHIYRRLGDYEAAIREYTRVLELGGSSGGSRWVLYQRATPLWITDRRAEALADYERFRRLNVHPFFSDVRRFFILHELGRATEAEQLVRSALNELEPCWLHRVFRCLAREITPAELVASPLAQSNAEMLCEACYYAGEMCLLLKRPAEARKWFEQCVQTGVTFDPNTALGTPMNEYELACWRLESLSPATPTTTQSSDTEER